MSLVLSAVLAGHATDVKAVLAVSDNELATASRDTTVMCWKRADKTDFLPEGPFRGHSHYVNALTYLKPTADHPNGLIASGGSDKTIQVFDPKAPAEPIQVLAGHTENVCALTTTPQGDILSGSWDFTAKLWRGGKCVATVKHQHSVWAVLGLADGKFLTGSADKSIKLWDGEKAVKTYTGHTDAVRGLAMAPDGNFVSCSNDGTLRIWSLDGECINELNGHTSFIYSVSVALSGEIASCGEDRSVRIWKNGNCVQTIFHPTPSVWSVAYLPNGDVVSGASDGFARVFTRSAERVASAEIQKAFDESVASQAIPSNQVGDVDKNKLPGLELLEKPGQKDGQVVMVNVGGSVEAHQWSSAENKWNKVGEVVDAVGNQRKKQWQGQDYDFVFDVDIGDGVPPLQLPYNATQNPYQAAQDFIWRNELPQDYLETVANFIVKNAGTATLGAQPSAYQDPFTGASRYVPGDAGAGATSANRQPGAGAPSSNTANQAGPKRLTPNTEYVLFKGGNLSAMSNKLSELNDALRDSQMPAALNSQQLDLLQKTMQSLATPSTFHEKFDDNQLEALLKAANFPPAVRFPAIDVLRLVILYAPTSKILESICTQFAKMSYPASSAFKVNETNALLSLRFLANAFASEEGQTSIWSQREDILKAIAKVSTPSNNKNLQIALATVHLSLATLTHARTDDHFGVDVLTALIELLKTKPDTEAALRGLVAVGTLICKNDDAKQIAELLDIESVLRDSQAPELAAAVSEVRQLLRKA
ncbi:hypothetical protein HDU87_001806 [Geranomyces variabilis]|uniref:Phospholipase A-2-activating protein n=1 Tax=Geranomyces variabilis TaxID=109894 RepID=A0AAD5XRR4_9FUNG|nr:hypothetical protein HDU87_001806 [Geranomyces variabilis]